MLASCSDEEFSYRGWLNQPIPIRYQNDLPLILIKNETGEIFDALLDSGTPLSIVQTKSQYHELDDNGVLNGSLITGITTRHSDISILDESDPNTTRFIFSNVEVVDTPLKTVGLNEPSKIGGVLGASLLNHFSINLQHNPPQMMLSDGINDTNSDLANDCDLKRYSSEGNLDLSCNATFLTVQTGGGEMLIGNQQTRFSATRLILNLCIGAEEFSSTAPSSIPSQLTVSGQPMTALISTGVGISLISRSAFNRLKTLMPGLEEIPNQKLYLQTGELTVSTTQIPRLSVVDDRNIALGACGELARRRNLQLAPFTTLPSEVLKAEGASVATLDHATPFAIVEDDAAIFQGLRQELSSLTPYIDIILGGSFFAKFVVDLDYPNSRTILRCAESTEECQVLSPCNQEDGPKCPGT